MGGTAGMCLGAPPTIASRRERRFRKLPGTIRRAGFLVILLLSVAAALFLACGSVAAAERANNPAPSPSKEGGDIDKFVEFRDGSGNVDVAFPTVAGDAASTEETLRGSVKRPRFGRARKYERKATASPVSTSSQSTKQIISKAWHRAVGGGIPGALAGVVQVLTLMWLRTVINYQYRYGNSFGHAFSALWNEGVARSAGSGDDVAAVEFWRGVRGGIRRLYSGVGFALIQAPITRFVSTAANDGVNALVVSFDATKRWGPGREVLLAAIVVGLARTMLMPLDTCKTVLQIESTVGFQNLMYKVREGKIYLLYSGALASAASSFVGHYPWFYTYNILSNSDAIKRYIRPALVRNAMIGFFSSIISDTTSNFIRVIKTTKQALGVNGAAVSYGDTVNIILSADGWMGLFFRGLKTRIFSNALQSIMFTVIWRGLADRRSRKDAKDGKSDDVSEDKANGVEEEIGEENDHESIIASDDLEASGDSELSVQEEGNEDNEAGER